MFSQKDEVKIRERGSNPDVVRKQIENFINGFPYLKVEEAATIGHGIIEVDKNAVADSGKFYDKKLDEGVVPLKFVPASGAASRMFKDLFEALEECKSNDDPALALAKNAKAREFLSNKEKFAFYNDLVNLVDKTDGRNSCVYWIDYLLNEKGLNYGNLPK